MSAVISAGRPANLARALAALGDIPLERIGLPAGSATEQHLIDALEAADKRLF